MDFAYVPPPKLERLSAETLARVDDDVIESSLVDYVLQHRIESESELDSISHLPEPLRLWYSAFVLDAEVLNGGFNQFFFNPSGELAEEAATALRRLGIAEAAECVERAMDLLEDHAPVLEKALEEGTIEAFMDTYLVQPFSELDRIYASGEERWRNARIQFIRNSLT